jgi:hypothetical protein
MPAPQVTTAVVVIVVDLSDPAGLLPTLLWWLEQVRLCMRVCVRVCVRVWGVVGMGGWEGGG